MGCEGVTCDLMEFCCVCLHGCRPCRNDWASSTEKKKDREAELKLYVPEAGKEMCGVCCVYVIIIISRNDQRDGMKPKCSCK